MSILARGVDSVFGDSYLAQAVADLLRNQDGPAQTVDLPKQPLTAGVGLAS